MNSYQGKIRTLRIAAIQVESQHGQIETNHAHATPLIEEAVHNGAEMVVLPELFACGYVPNKTIWDYAEPKEGRTVTWLRETSSRLGIYLGAGLVEVEGTDLFNDFVMTTPGGKVAGRARKANAEACCFRRGRGNHIINTDIGKIGVGICADNHFSAFPKLMQANFVDLMLMPHAWPTLYRTSGLASEEDMLRMEKEMIGFAPLYASLLGVPAVFVNAVGTMGRMPGLVGKLMNPGLFRLQGLSRIVDLDGTLKGALGKKEGVLVSEVTLDPSRKQHKKPKDYGGWLHPGSALLRKVIMPLDLAWSIVYYRFNLERRKKAMHISSLA